MPDPIPLRPPCSDAERRAANLLAEELRGAGREGLVEPTRVRPHFARTHFLHSLAGIPAAIIAVSAPRAGLALALLALASAIGDLTGAFDLVRRLTGSRASQNVHSPARAAGRPGTILLIAPYDSELRPFRWFPAVVGGLVLVSAAAGAATAGAEGLPVRAALFAGALTLLATLPFLGDRMIRPDDESPADTSAAELATRLAVTTGDTLRHFGVHLLFPGSRARFALGTRAWLRRHRLDPTHTVVIELGAPQAASHYAPADGLLVRSRYHPELTALCDELGAKTLQRREFSQAHAARLRGYPAVAVLADEHFCADLMALIDERFGPRL